jgi:uncharacterized protein
MTEQSFQFVMQQGPTQGKVIKLSQNEAVIGRDTANAIVINDPGVSRRHARLRFEGGSYLLQDLGSSNGTFVNDEKLEGERFLRPGDSIRMGASVVLSFGSASVGQESTMVYSTPTVRLDKKAAAGGSKAEEHRALFTRWFEELWNRKNYAITEELVDEGFTAHGAGGQDIKQGPKGVADMVSIWHKAFPDGHMTLDDLITEGDLSVIRMTFRGTHQGEFYGIPASGKAVEVTSIGIDRVIDGRITEGWGELNMLGMMQQMGAIPAQGNAIEADVTPEHVMEAYAALGSGDINQIQKYWAEEMVWQVPGHNELSGWYYSRDEFLAFMGKVGEMSDHSFHMDLVAGKVLVTGDYSVDLTRNRGYRKGQPKKTMDIEVAHVLRWRDGKVIAGKGAIFGDGATEYDQFWSSSPAVTPPTH